MKTNIALLYCSIALLSCEVAEKKSEDDTIAPAFPTAEGFGMYTKGGRGGEVFIVTNLDDYAADEEIIDGSLRQAVESEGSRTVVFEVGGTIALKRDLKIMNPFITIAGQTAVGDGICLKDYPLVVEADEVIIRYLRTRVGEAARGEVDALGVNRNRNLIIDHVSASWSTDENLSSYSELATIQWSIISEGLMHSYHPKGPHSMGSIIDAKFGGVSLHHNLYAHNNARNPLVQNKGEAPGAIIEIEKNVIYNWGEKPSYTSSPGRARINLRNNYYKPGPSTQHKLRNFAFENYNRYTNLYVQDNFHTENRGASLDNFLLVSNRDSVQHDFSPKDEPYVMFPYTAEEPETVYGSVLKSAGANRPRRDGIDTRIISEVRTGTGRIINSPQEVMGYPTYVGGNAPLDTDRDGMPDAFETQHQLSPQNYDDHRLDADADGYTNLEEYLNGTDPNRLDLPHFSHDAFLEVLERLDSTNLEDQKLVEAQLEEEQRAFANRAIPDYSVKLVPILGDSILELQIGDQSPVQFNKIPAGTFMMGSPTDEPGREDWEQLHQVTISKSFYMATVEASNAFIEQVTGEEYPPDNTLPAYISWYDAQWVCDILSKKTGRTFRLPTEAEWEYACRAGTTTAYFTGESIDLEYANHNIGPDHEKTLRPVSQGKSNPWGLKNMPGNQFEWCSDWKGEYPEGPVTDPRGGIKEGSAGFDGLYRKIMRGGNYGSSKEYIRSAYRYDYTRDVRYGFRLVMDFDGDN